MENAWSTSTKSPPLASTASAAPVVPDNPWSNSGEDISSVFSKPATYPSLSTQSTLQPKQPSSLNISTSVSPPADDGWAAFGEGEAVDVEKPSPATPAATPSGNLAGMSKEEKAAEMARRREERKAVSNHFLLSYVIPCSTYSVLTFFGPFQMSSENCTAQGAEKGWHIIIEY